GPIAPFGSGGRQFPQACEIFIPSNEAPTAGIAAVAAAVCTTASVSFELRGSLGRRLSGVRGSGCSTHFEYGFAAGRFRKASEIAGATASLTIGVRRGVRTAVPGVCPPAALIANACFAAAVCPRLGKSRMIDVI